MTGVLRQLHQHRGDLRCRPIGSRQVLRIRPGFRFWAKHGCRSGWRGAGVSQDARTPRLVSIRPRRKLIRAEYFRHAAPDRRRLRSDRQRWKAGQASRRKTASLPIGSDRRGPTRNRSSGRARRHRQSSDGNDVRRRTRGPCQSGAQRKILDYRQNGHRRDPRQWRHSSRADNRFLYWVWTD